MQTNNSWPMLKQLGLKTQLENVEEILASNYDFKFNLVTGRVEFRPKDRGEFEELTDRVFKSMYREILHLGFGIHESRFGCILQSDFVKEYDPFKEYFTGLTWDGTDYIGQLAATIRTSNQPFWERALKKWLVAVVSCAMNMNENHSVLVLSGLQGVGKTSWLESLRPKKLFKYYHSGSIDPHNNDTLTNICETLFINLDELENLNRLELGNLKEVITKKTVRQRRPYERFHNLYMRRASFMGSINDREFLTDITGNRRYLCFNAEEISAHNISMDNVFAQAHHILINGEEGHPFKYWFSGDDLVELETNNEEYVRRSLEEELIRRHFELPRERSQIRLLTPSEIIIYINKSEAMNLLDKSSLKRIGQIMHKLGFTKRSLQSSKPYLVAVKRKKEALGNL